MTNFLSRLFQKSNSKKHPNTNLQLEIEKTQREIDSYDNYTKGINFESQEKYEEAIECFNRAIELDFFNDDFIYACRGRCYQLLNKNELAIEDFNKAISLNPNILYNIYYFRAQSNNKLSRFYDSAADLKNVISILEQKHERTKDENDFYYDVKRELIHLEYTIQRIESRNRLNQLVEKAKKERKDREELE
jgi:tetratricopeptide (TPR) repeat protein